MYFLDPSCIWCSFNMMNSILIVHIMHALGFMATLIEEEYDVYIGYVFFSLYIS